MQKVQSFHKYKSVILAFFFLYKHKIYATAKKWYGITRTKTWDEMSWYEMVLARQVPEPEWYPAGLFGACISRSEIYVLLACKAGPDSKRNVYMKVISLEWTSIRAKGVLKRYYRVN